MGWISMWQYVHTEHFEGDIMFGLLCNERHKIRLCASSFVVATTIIVSRAYVWKWQRWQLRFRILWLLSLRL
jgi:hypothetical protein